MTSIVVTAVLVAGAVVALARSGAPGPQGPRGHEGRAGKAGPKGERGPGSYRQKLAVNWQNGASTGRDRQSFTAPGIGTGEVVCNTDRQQLVFRPDDRTKDTAMWITRIQDQGFGKGTEMVVRTARREFNTGDEFNEGLNFQGYSKGGTESVATGMFTGLISSRGSRTSYGEPGPAPTSFRFVWHWNFGSGNNRCYVAATFLTRQGDAL